MKEEEEKNNLENIQSKTGLIQEVILTLAGHGTKLNQQNILLNLIKTNQTTTTTTSSSSSSTSSSSSSSNLIKLHPAAIKSLTKLIQISNLYNQLNEFANQVTQFNSSDHIINSISTFGSSLLLELSIYQNLLVDLEFRLLSHNPSLVPADANQSPSPPLTTILAEIVEWLPIFQGLVNLVNEIEIQLKKNSNLPISSPNLIQLIYHHSLTGSPRLAEILSRLQDSIEQVWIDAFRSFVLYGHAPIESSKSNPSHLPLDDLFFTHQLVLNAGLSSHSYQPIRFSFRENGLPNLPVLDPIDQLKDSIQEICLALSILNHLLQPNHINSSTHSHSKSTHFIQPQFNKIPLPIDLQYQLRKSLYPINRLSHPGFRFAIKKIQEVLSNYLFSTHLTPEILSTTLQNLTDVFLLRHGTFARNLVEGFIRLKSNRLGNGGSNLMNTGMDDNHKSLRVRRLMSLSERELDVILIKAGISTELGEEPSARKISLDGFSFRILRIKQEIDQEDDQVEKNDQNDDQFLQITKSLIDQTFSKLILNSSHPVLLTYSPPPGLSLFLANEVCSSYSKINSCLFSFLITKQMFKDCWRELNQRERLRTKWIREENQEIIQFTRLAFEGLRRMSWFIDLMVTYFFHDVIDQSVDLLSKEIHHQYQSFNNSNDNPEETQSQNDYNDIDEDDSNQDVKKPIHSSTKCNSLNFFKSHKMFLVLIEIGLGLKNPNTEKIMKLLLKSCLEFLIKVENWSFDLIPNLFISLDLKKDVIDDKNDKSEEEDKNINLKIKERGNQLIKSIQNFNQLLNDFIVELRKDDMINTSFNSSSTTSSSKAKSNKSKSNLNNSNINIDHSFNDVSDSDFFLKASIFRRKSLDSLLLNFDFNHWFSSNTAHPSSSPP